MKVAIAGGSGFIGQALANSLIEDNHAVIVLTRQQDGRHSPGLSFVQWDGKSPGRWVEALEGADAVINLTGVNIGGGLWTKSRKEAILESRLSAGRALTAGLEQMANHPGVLVQASAIGYYGTSLTKTFSEDDPPGSDWLAGVAAQWEDSTAGVERLGIRRVIIRSGLVLDRSSIILNRTALPFRFLVGGPLGRGQQWWSWIHLADEVAAIRFLAGSPSASGPFNLTAPDPRQNASFAAALGRALRLPSWLPAPAFALKLVLGDMSMLVLDGQRVLPGRLQEAGFAFKYPTLDQALAAIFTR